MKNEQEIIKKMYKYFAKPSTEKVVADRTNIVKMMDYISAAYQDNKISKKVANKFVCLLGSDWIAVNNATVSATYIELINMFQERFNVIKTNPLVKDAAPFSPMKLGLFKKEGVLS